MCSKEVLDFRRLLGYDVLETETYERQKRASLAILRLEVMCRRFFVLVMSSEHIF